MNTNNYNGPDYNNNYSEKVLGDLPKHERPLKIKLGSIKNSGVAFPKPVLTQYQLNNLPSTENLNRNIVETEKNIETSTNEQKKGNNVYVNVSIYFAKNIQGIGTPNPSPPHNFLNNPDIIPNQPTLQLNPENHRKSREEPNPPSITPNQPIQQVKPIKSITIENNQFTSLFENSQDSDVDTTPKLHKRDLNEIKCACHHLHTSDKIKLSRFSYKSQMRRIKLRWTGLPGDFPIIFKKKFMRFYEDCESVSVSEVIDFSNKLIQPDAEFDLFGARMI